MYFSTDFSLQMLNIFFLVNTFIESKDWTEMIDSISDLDLSSQTFKDLLIIIFISPRAKVKQ